MDNIPENKQNIIRDDHDDKDECIWLDEPLVNLINMLATNMMCGNFRVLSTGYQNEPSIVKHPNFILHRLAIDTRSSGVLYHNIREASTIILGF